jgi:5'-deoxynucleotidase YfbR-like HD superfamily hydrolase
MAGHNVNEPFLAILLENLPHQHATVREFLIAEHVVERVASGDISHDNLLDYLYPYGINRFIKSIINRNPDTQRLILQSVQKLYIQAGNTQKAHLAYLLGRFEDRAIRIEAIKILRGFLHDSKKSRKAQNNPHDADFRQWLLLQRTIYISLIYSNDRVAASEYLSLLLKNPIWDDLNRGFHLEYYEDIQQSPAPASMLAFDDVNIRPRKTYSVLFEKLSLDLLRAQTREMAIIELHTLCSLCVVRLLSGKLSDNKRIRLLELVEKVLEGGLIRVPAFYRPYLEMTIDILQRPQVSIGSIFSELLGLKNVVRAGWNASRVLRGKEIVRRCLNPESVADHTFGCLLIAEMFLPERSNEANYSKPEILRTLLIHDLAETYLGDQVKFKKTEDDIEKENRVMRRIAAFGNLEAFSGSLSLRQSWDNFYNNNNINAQIAEDIDKIECFLQLINYHGQENCSIPDAESWANEIENGLQTEHGKRIIESLRHEGADTLSWYRK